MENLLKDMGKRIFDRRKQLNMTQETLAELALPIMISSMLGTAYSIMDMAWIGLLGSKAVAGIGVGGMFTWLSQGFASMARMGGQVQVAQCVGRGDKEKAHGYAQAAVQLATVMGLVYALVVLIFTKQMIGFFKLEDPEAYAAAFVYTKIACGLIVFSFLSVTLTGIYTAQGDSKTPFYLCNNSPRCRGFLLCIRFPRKQPHWSSMA